MMAFVKAGEVDLTLISDSDSDSDSASEEEVNQLTDASRLLQHKQVASSPQQKKRDVKNGCVISLHSFPDDDSSAPLINHPQESDSLKEKQKSELFSCLAVAVVCLFQAVPFPIQSLGAILLNVQGEELRQAVTISIYTTFLISCLGTPALLRLISPKWVICLGCAGSFIYTVVRLAPDPYVVVGGALFAGLTQGSLLGAAGVLITHHGTQYAVCGGHSLPNILGLFHGIFYALFLGAPFINSFLRLAILPPEDGSGSGSDHALYGNETVVPATEPKLCGIHYCWTTDHSNVTINHMDSAAKHKMQALLGTHIVCALGAWLLAVLALDRNSKRTGSDSEYTKKEKENCRNFVKDLHLAATVLQWKDINFGMLLVMMLYTGVQQVVGYQVVIKAFVVCDSSWLHHLLVMLCLSGASMLVAAPVGFLNRYVGRVKFMVIAVAIQIAVYATLLAWRHPPQWVYYVMMTFWGAADATLQLELAAMIGILMPDDLEASFGGMRFWQMLGHLFLYLMRLYLCSAVVLAVCLMLLLIAAGLYISLEIMIRLQEQEQKTSKAKHQNYVLPEFAAWIPHFNPHHRGVTEDLCTKLGSDAEDLIST